MASAYITLHDDDVLKAHVLQIESSGERFINIDIGDCSISLPGRDYVAVTHAFALAKAIQEAAEELQAALQEQQAPEVVQ
jgi:hypothetical protein